LTGLRLWKFDFEEAIENNKFKQRKKMIMMMKECFIFLVDGGEKRNQ